MIRKLLTLAGATLLSVALAELLIRFAGIAPAVRVIDVTAEGSTYIRSHNPILAYEMRPNLRGSGESLFVPQYTNQHGRRDIEREVSKRKGVRRILLLGDSVVANLDVWETDKQMSRQLERLYPDDSIEVLNFGVGGYCTLAEVELLRTKGLQFQPDIVVLLFVENDFDNFNSEVGMIMERAGESHRLFQALANSHLARLVGTFGDRAQLLGQHDSIASHTDAVGDNNVHQRIELLHKLSQQHEFDVLIAIWPVFESDGIRDARFMPDGQELIIEALAETYGLPTIRLSSYFATHWRSTGKPNPRTLYTVGDKMHPNEYGARVAATALKAALDSPVQSARNLDTANRDIAIELAREESLSQLDSVTALIHGGQVASAFGDKTQALAHFEAATRLSPENFAALHSTGHLLYQLRRYDEAEHFTGRALAVDPTSPAAHYTLGLIARAQGDNPSAIQPLEMATRLPQKAHQSRPYPWVEQAHVEYARLLAMEGNSKGAMAHLDNAIAANPTMPIVRFELARFLKANGALSMATEHYRRILNDHPNPEVVHNNLAVVLEKAGNSTRAEAHYHEAVAINPDYAAALNNLGVMMFKRGDLDASQTYFRRALEADASLEMARQNLEAVLQRQGGNTSDSRSHSTANAP